MMLTEIIQLYDYEILATKTWTTKISQYQRVVENIEIQLKKYSTRHLGDALLRATSLNTLKQNIVQLLI